MRYCDENGMINKLNSGLICCYESTDVQYTEKGEQPYKTMWKELGEIIVSIKDKYKSEEEKLLKNSRSHK